MIFGSLFSGIGGMDRGLELAGMTCAWQVEVDEWCLRTLEKLWPEVPKYKDVRDVGKENLETVDLIAGGFPCQPHSVAGKQRGAEDDRNLWPEFSRVIRELKPRYVLAENVPGITTTYLDTVLSDLESQAYTCATFNLPAVAFDAPHRRERIFIVAHRLSMGREERTGERIQSEIGQSEGQESEYICEGIPRSGDVSHPSTMQRASIKRDEQNGVLSEVLADTDKQGLQGSEESGNPVEKGKKSKNKLVGRFDRRGGAWRTVESDVGRSPDGIPLWLDRHIGRGMSHEESTGATKVLRKLWDKNVAKTLWQAIGGFNRIQKAEILFAVVRQHENYPDKTRILLESEETFEGFVRSLWDQGKITGSPYRSANRKQSRREYPDSMQTLSRLLAFDGKTNWQISDWEDGIPRVATGVPSRVDRLRGLGNAVVPQVAQWIGERIMEFDNA